MKKKVRAERAPSRRGGSRGLRTALIALIVLAVIAVLAGAAGSIAIHRILITKKICGWINGDPETLRLEYASADGWFPWDVRVHGLEMRGRDPNVEWYFRMDEVRLAFAPLELLGRRFHMTRVRATGLVFRLRERVPRGEEARAHFAALPPIPGFPAEPRRADAPEAISAGKPFHIVLDDLRVEAFRELWIDIWRLGGEGTTGTLAGGFDLYPNHSVRVAPSRVAISGGTLALGRHPICRPVAFTTDGEVRAFDPATVHGNDVWPFMSGRVRMDGPLVSLDFMNHFLRNSPEPRLSAGAGALKMALAIDRGKGTGEITTVSRRVVGRYAKSEITADATVRARIREWDFQRDRIDLGGTLVDLKDVSAGQPGPDSRDWWGRFDLRSAQVRGDRPAAFLAKVAIRARDARPLFTLFGTNLPGWARGLLKLEGLDAHGSVGLGKKYVDLDDFEAAGGQFRIRGRYRERADSETGAFLVESGVLAIGLDIGGGKSTIKLLGARRWYEEKTAVAPGAKR